MPIAVVAWGSLVWCPGSLAMKTRWRRDGPRLPIEFARISQDDRVTLVIHLESEEQWPSASETAREESTTLPESPQPSSNCTVGTEARSQGTPFLPRDPKDFVTRLLPDRRADPLLLTVRHVAERLGVCTATVYRRAPRATCRMSACCTPSVWHRPISQPSSDGNAGSSDGLDMVARSTRAIDGPAEAHERLDHPERDDAGHPAHSGRSLPRVSAPANALRRGDTEPCLDCLARHAPRFGKRVRLGDAAGQFRHLDGVTSCLEIRG